MSFMNGKLQILPGTKKKLLGLSLLAVFVATSLSTNATSAKDGYDKVKIAVKQTKRFEFKEGFERAPKDILNTLKDNEVTRFTKFLEGLDLVYIADDLKSANKYHTVFAPSDDAFKKMNADDLQKKFADKKSLRSMLKMHMVEGKFYLDDLRKKGSLKTVDGRTIKLTNRMGNIFANNAFVSTADIKCNNGVIHVVDSVVFPQ